MRSPLVSDPIATCHPSPRLTSESPSLCIAPPPLPSMLAPPPIGVNEPLARFERAANRRLAKYKDKVAPVRFANRIDNTIPNGFVYEEMEFSRDGPVRAVGRMEGDCQCIHCRQIPLHELKQMTGLQYKVRTLDALPVTHTG